MREEIRASIGSRLKEEREQRLHWSQEYLAGIVGSSRRAVVEWERGASTPGADAITLLGEAGMDVLYVLTGTRTPTARAALSPEEKALLDNYKNADDEGRAAARRILDALAQPNKKRA